MENKLNYNIFTHWKTLHQLRFRSIFSIRIQLLHCLKNRLKIHILHNTISCQIYLCEYIYAYKVKTQILGPTSRVFDYQIWGGPENKNFTHTYINTHTHTYIVLSVSLTSTNQVCLCSEFQNQGHSEWNGFSQTDCLSVTLSIERLGRIYTKISTLMEFIINFYFSFFFLIFI